MDVPEEYSPWFLQGSLILVGWLQDFKMRGGTWYKGGTFARCGVKRQQNEG